MLKVEVFFQTLPILHQWVSTHFPTFNLRVATQVKKAPRCQLPCFRLQLVDGWLVGSGNFPKYLEEWADSSHAASRQEALDYYDNQFRMIVTKDRHGNYVREVKWSMDLGSIHKLGKKGRATKCQQETQRVGGKAKRGAVAT